MLLQEIDWSRILVILGSQLFISIFFIYLSYKILKRRSDKLTFICSSFFLSVAAGFIINVIYFSLRVNPLVYILHTFTLFLLLFGPTFLILFTIEMHEDFSEIKQNSRLKELLIIIGNAALILIIIIFSDGIIINDETDWSPIWSWNFLILLYFYLTICILIPFVYFSIKMYLKMEDKILKRRWLLYFIGFFGMGLSIYGLILYNTWNNLTFKIIWSIVGLLISTLSGFLIYYGIVRNL